MALSVGLDYRDNGFNPSILSFFCVTNYCYYGVLRFLSKFGYSLFPDTDDLTMF